MIGLTVVFATLSMIAANTSVSSFDFLTLFFSKEKARSAKNLAFSPSFSPSLSNRKKKTDQLRRRGLESRRVCAQARADDVLRIFDSRRRIAPAAFCARGRDGGQGRRRGRVRRRQARLRARRRAEGPAAAAAADGYIWGSDGRCDDGRAHDRGHAVSGSRGRRRDQ